MLIFIYPLRQQKYIFGEVPMKKVSTYEKSFYNFYKKKVSMKKLKKKCPKLSNQGSNILWILQWIKTDEANQWMEKKEVNILFSFYFKNTHTCEQWMFYK